MDWLAQNWLWIVLIVAAAYFFLGHRRGPRSYGHHGYPGSSGASGAGQGGYEGGGTSGEPPQQTGRVTSAIDPVTRKDVSTATAFTSVYRGRIYYFETAESRQRFEASPEQYAREELGHLTGQAGNSSEQHHSRHRGGCC